MVKQRLLFTLLLNKSTYVLSRNFKLQQVGNLEWLKKHYDFNSIAFSIDELVVLNVEREHKDVELFCRDLLDLSKDCFMPIAAGGGISSADTAYKLFNAGADKLVINTILFKNIGLVKQLVGIFGGQSIVASIDYKTTGPDNEVYIENGQSGTGTTVFEAVKRAIDLGVGEIYLTSMNRDGTGQGYDLETLVKATEMSPIPVIASGGVGRFEQLVEGIKKCPQIGAVSTANLFNFMADGLTEARQIMAESGIVLAQWDPSLVAAAFHS